MSIRFGRSGNGYDSSEVMETEDDDWRKVTDLNERRKIQNRLAQRNYRRKLRQRLEELERQAGRNSGSSSSVPAKRRAKQPSAGVGTIIAASARDHAITGSRGVGSTSRNPQGLAGVGLDEPLTSLESLLSPPSVSGGSEDSSTSVSSPGLYASDFGPLFLPPISRHQEQPYPMWQAVQHHAQYPQTQPYGPGQSYLSASPSHPSTTAAPGAASPESPAIAQHQIQSYISPSTDCSLAIPLTPTASLQDSNTSSSYQQNSRQNVHIELPERVNFPAPPPTYSPDPTVNPNPWHLNPPLPRDELYMTLNYSKLFNATMSIAKILNIDEAEMLEDDTPSPFYREDGEESPFEVPESAPDLQPTRMQREIRHHPYIDAVPFKSFRDKLLNYVQKGEETGNHVDEANICRKMYESWGVWGECPWEGRSWEIGEAFAR